MIFLNIITTGRKYLYYPKTMNHQNLITYFLLLILFFTACTSGTKPEKQNQTKAPEKKQINTYRAENVDIEVFKKIMQYAQREKLSMKTLPEVEITIARYFLTTPYVPKTLEKDGAEHLVINLRELDCTTFLENVVSLSLCIMNKTTDFETYCQTLIKFRYRSGKIDEYPSRLHYFTDWLLDNEKKQLISIVSNTFATDMFDPTVSYMSTHTKNYPQLKNEAFVKQIAEKEKGISKAKLTFVPEENIHDIEKHVQNGDLIAITTTIEGLDIAHVGLAYFVNEHLHLFHASSTQKKVVISEKTLQDYLKGIKKNNGIIVARLR